MLKPGGYVVINVAALEMLKGDHSAFAGEVRRYNKPELAAKLKARRFHGETADLHERIAVPDCRGGAGSSAAARY